MNGLFSRFQKWLRQNRHFYSSWLTTDEQELSPPEKSLVELPPKLEEKLIAATQKLPSNPGDLEEVQSALDRAFHSWQKHPHTADNSIVILSSPVTAVSRILTKSIGEWATDNQVEVRRLQWLARPNQSEVKFKLQQQLGRGVISPESKRSEVVVISNLGWCFLRSFEGLDGIDYLKDFLLQDRSRFWVIGSGQIGWEYLNSVCRFQAYVGEKFSLPALSAEELQEWLNPIIEEFELKFEEHHNHSLVKNEKSPQTEYFEKLATLSDGGSTVAVQLFLRSIYYESADKTEADRGFLKLQNPRLPNLPNLELDDYYLLYSLLLHGDLTLSELAESLGDEQSLVKSQVQILRRAGVIEQQKNILCINPIYYPQLKDELDQNNFVIREFE